MPSKGKSTVHEDLAKTFIAGRLPPPQAKYRPKIKARPMGPEERAEIVELLHRKMTPKLIAERYRRHIATVFKIAKEQGIAPTNIAPEKAIQARILAAREQRLVLLHHSLTLLTGEYKKRTMKIIDPDTKQEYSVWAGPVAELETVIICLGIVTDKCQKEEEAMLRAPAERDEQKRERLFEAFRSELDRTGRLLREVNDGQEREEEGASAEAEEEQEDQ